MTGNYAAERTASIASDDVDALGTLESTHFTHTPRPPGIPGASPRHRDYLNHSSGSAIPSNYLNNLCDESSTGQFITLHRSATKPAGILCLSIENGHIEMKLAPAALRELARMCIDAAHDIEVNP